METVLSLSRKLKRKHRARTGLPQVGRYDYGAVSTQQKQAACHARATVDSRRAFLKPALGGAACAVSGCFLYTSSLTVLSLAGAVRAAEIPSRRSSWATGWGRTASSPPGPRSSSTCASSTPASDRVSIESAGRLHPGQRHAGRGHHLGGEPEATSTATARSPAAWPNPDGLSEDGGARAFAEGKTIALVTCSIHSTEVGLDADGDGVRPRRGHHAGPGDARAGSTTSSSSSCPRSTPTAR